jgi:hypothetical protein
MPSIAQDGNRRCYHAVAVEQGGPTERDQDQDIPCARVVCRSLSERQQSQNPTFALVVGAHDQQDVFAGDDHNQRPHDQ